MKVLIVLFCLVATIASFRITDDEQENLQGINLDCQREYTCSREVLRDPFQYLDDEPLGQYMNCFAENYGILTPEGDFDEESVLDKLRLVCEPGENPHYYYKKCAHRSLYPSKTAINFWNCLNKLGFQYFNNIVD